MVNARRSLLAVRCGLTMKAAFYRLSPCLLKLPNTYRGSVAEVDARSPPRSWLPSVRTLKRLRQPGANTHDAPDTKTGAIDFRL